MRRLQTKDPTLVQVLSLYLLLLAFFVVLFNASRFDAGRMAAVGESLTSTFEATRGLPGDARRNTSQQGRLLGDELVLASVADLVKTELAVARVHVVRPGRLMLARFPEEALFVPGTADVLAEREGLVAGVADILGRAPEGRRHKVEIQVGSHLAAPDELGGDVPLPVARAAGFAELLVARGAIAGTVMSGVSFETPGEVRMLFRIDPEIRPEDDAAANGPGDGA